MRSTLLVVGFISLLSSSVFGQDSSTLKANQGADVGAIQRAAVAALNFRQGDAAGLNHSRADFTADGWKDFMKTMEAFLDDKGAPTFTSTFVAARLYQRLCFSTDLSASFPVPFFAGCVCTKPGVLIRLRSRGLNLLVPGPTLPIYDVYSRDETHFVGSEGKLLEFL